MLNATRFTYLLAHPEALNTETLYDLRVMVNRYPSSQSLRLLYLQNLYLLHDATFGAELRNSALYITDRKILFHLLEGHRFQLTPNQKVILATEEQQENDDDRTLSLIDSFLSTLPQDADTTLEDFTYAASYSLTEETPPQRKTVQTLEQPVDYDLTTCEEDEEKTDDETYTLQPLTATSDKREAETSVTNARNSRKTGMPQPPPVADTSYFDEDDVPDESYFTETLAKIYVKQRRYGKALEILNRLSLIYPKKNAYFADQIRFLQKLIINEKTK